MDERLRTLEREARARPDDRAAGWRLVRALEQAGDALGAWREVCRLARAGDDEAWAELERPPVGARTLEVTARRELDGPILPGGVHGGSGLLAIARRGVEVLDARTLETVWRDEQAYFDAVVAGPYVGHRARDRREVVVRRLATGDEVVRVAVDGVRDVQASADWLVAFGELETVVVELGERRGAVERRGADRFGNVVRDVILVEDHDARGRRRSVTASPLDGAARRWSAPGCLEHVDARTLLLRADELAAHDVATGALRWSHAVPAVPPPGLAFAPDLVVVSTPERIEAMDRATGAVRWTVTTNEKEPAHVAAASDAVYVAVRSRPAPRKHRLTLRALDAATGAARGEAIALERSVRGVRLAAVPGGVVVFADVGREVRLVRLGD